MKAIILLTVRDILGGKPGPEWIDEYDAAADDILDVIINGDPVLWANERIVHYNAQTSVVNRDRKTDNKRGFRELVGIQVLRDDNTTPMGFANALVHINHGFRMRRNYWPDDMFIFRVPGSAFKVNRPPLLGVLSEGVELQYASHIDMHVGNGGVMVWNPTIADIDGEDWLPVADDQGVFDLFDDMDDMAASPGEVSEDEYLEDDS